MDKMKTLDGIMDAQADLQTAIGFFKMDHMEGVDRNTDATLDRMYKALARLHKLLGEEFEIDMYGMATHPDV